MKLKQCSNCGKFGPLWTSKPPLCPSCAKRNAKPIKKISEARADKTKQYNVLRNDFLLTHPSCGARLIGCTDIATDIHHLYSGARRDEFFLDVKTWMALCRHCHDRIHNVLSASEAKQLNLKK